MSALVKFLSVGLAVVIIGVLVYMIRDVFRKMSGSGVILLAGLATLFLGERVFGMGDWRAPVSGAGLAVVALAIGLRVFAWSRSTGRRRAGHQQALVFMGISVASLALYALTLGSVTDALGMDEEAAARWSGVLSALWPIGVIVGGAPVFLLDRMLALHPMKLPAGAARDAVMSGLAVALAASLVFPVNYLADAYDAEWDVAYFRTTRPGTSTLALVATLPEPVTATLFYPHGNDVGRELEPYFRELEAAGQGTFTAVFTDQALDAKLAEDLKIRENGFIALTQGEVTEKFKIGTDLDRAKRDLKKLDGTVQKHLIQLTKGKRTVYLLTGHGEASNRERDDPLRKLNLFKRNILENQNFTIKNLGVTEGSAVAVPDDAAAVIIGAPEQPLLAEESRILADWFADGGRLLVLLDPGADPMEDLLTELGVQAGTHPLAHAEAFVPATRRGTADRVMLVTNKYGSHESVKTLSRNSSQLGVILPTVVSVQKTADTEHKVSTLMRSFPDTWPDADGDREPSEGEEKKVYELAVAVTPSSGEGRAIVVGDVNLLSDVVVGSSKGNQVFAFDAMRWLVGDEDIAGEVNTEEDVKIQHTRDEDVAWFYVTIFAVPALVLLFGLFLTRIRRRVA